MLQTKPRITVLIPTFNRENYLPLCLDSIFSQTLQPHQIIVVNDGSTDNTRNVLEPFLSKIDYAEIDNQGKSVAINHSLKMVTGDYLWILDDDDVALPDALERFVAPLEKHQEYDFSFGSFYFAGSNEKDYTIGKITHEFKIPDLDTRGPFIPLLEANYLCGAGLFARRSCYDQIGDFDPALIRSEDYDMAIRLTRAFNGINVQDKPTFYYRQHQVLRGSVSDRFPYHQTKRKSLEYDQIIFRRLHKKLPLEEYLPPGSSLDINRRQAILQRMAIMASKLLIPEAAEDLEELQQLNIQHPFIEPERKIIAKMVLETPWYEEGKLIDTVSFESGLNSALFSDQNAVLEITDKISEIVNTKKVRNKTELLEIMLSFSQPNVIVDLLLSLIRNREKGLFVS